MSKLPPLNGLRAFDISGRHLNFRSASEELGVTQGAVAQQVRGLEDYLGFKLFFRKPKGLEFTAIGRSYHTQIEGAFLTVKNATDEMRPDFSKVLISVTPTFASKWLIPNLPDFTEKHPDIDLRVLATEGISSFYSDGIDLAVRQASPPFGASIDAHLLFQQEIIAVASPLLIDGLPLPLGEADFLRLPKLHDTHDLWPSFLSMLSIKHEVSRGLRLNQTALAIDAAVAGQGITLTSRFLVEQDVNTKRLVQVIDHTLGGKSDFYLLTRRTENTSVAVQSVIKWIQDIAHADSLI